MAPFLAKIIFLGFVGLTVEGFNIASDGNLYLASLSNLAQTGEIAPSVESSQSQPMQIQSPPPPPPSSSTDVSGGLPPRPIVPMEGAQPPQSPVNGASGAGGAQPAGEPFRFQESGGLRESGSPPPPAPLPPPPVSGERGSSGFPFQEGQGFFPKPEQRIEGTEGGKQMRQLPPVFPQRPMQPFRESGAGGGGTTGGQQPFRPQQPPMPFDRSFGTSGGGRESSGGGGSGGGGEPFRFRFPSPNNSNQGQPSPFFEGGNLEGIEASQEEHFEEFEEFEQRIDPREIQNILREIKQMSSEVKRIAAKLKRLGSNGDISRLNEISSQLNNMQAILSDSSASQEDLRDAIDEFRDSNYREEVNALRLKAELPTEIKRITKELTKLERVVKTKAAQSLGLDLSRVNQKISEMRQVLDTVQNAYNSGDYEEAMEAMQYFHEEGWPGDISQAILRIREIKGRLRRIKDSGLRTQIEQALSNAISQFNAGEYREARESLDAIQRQMMGAVNGRNRSSNNRSR